MGGPIGLIQSGDIINIDVEKRRIDVQISDEEMERRKKNFTPPPYKANRGVLYKVYEILEKQLYPDHISHNFPDKFSLCSNFQYIKNVVSASEGCVTDE